MKIVDKEIIGQDKNTRIIKLEVEDFIIASRFSAGQFILLMVTETGERIPLTISDRNLDKGTITLIFQEVGYSTKLLGQCKKGDCLYALVGPLGNQADIANYGKVLVIGAGAGIAVVYPVAKALLAAGCQITAVLGARTKSLIILKEKIEKYAEKIFVTTDDGTLGRKGFVTDILEDIFSRDNDFSLVYCAGPIVVMKKTAEITKQYDIKTIVSLNAIMLDGTGMCGTCRVKLGEETKFCCADGPDFNAHVVNFDELSARQNRFLDKEKEILGFKKK